MKPKEPWVSVAAAALKERDGPSYLNKLVVVESPYSGNVARNRRYLRACLRDSLIRGEYPFASHAIYTQPGVLNDHDPEERRLGILAGLRWGRNADATIVYGDLGITSGMVAGMTAATERGRPVCLRSLGGRWAKKKKGTP